MNQSYVSRSNDEESVVQHSTVRKIIEITPRSNLERRAAEVVKRLLLRRLGPIFAMFIYENVFSKQYRLNQFWPLASVPDTAAI